MKVYGNIRLASVSGKGKTFSVLELCNVKNEKRDCRVLLVGKEKERK